MRHVLILAGGSGTRLWPFSTAAQPKQLVPLLEGRSLLEIAVERARSAVPAERVWLGAGEQLRDAVEAVPGLRADRLVVEPSPRDTLAAVALGCAVIARADPAAVIAVLTADHLIEPLETFAQALDDAFVLAEAHDDLLVTFGVVPDAPATGFGYLELGAGASGAPRTVTRFREKPTQQAAEQFLAAGPERYLWNSGMFVWQAATLRQAVEVFAPDSAAPLHQLAAAYGGAAWQQAAARLWPEVVRQSIDYGVLEPASTSKRFRIAAVPLTARWLDVGSWPAYGEALAARGLADTDGNSVSGRVLLDASRHNVVTSTDPDHLVALVGCEGLVVVHTAEATLVMPAERAQQVKQLHARVAQEWPELA